MIKSKKKNIWIINQYAGSPYHGMVYRSYYFAKNFIEMGFKVNIFTASFSHVRYKNPNIEKKLTIENIDGIDYVWIKVRKYNKSKSLGRLFSLFEFSSKLFFIKVSNFSKPDFIIVSSASPFPIVNAWIWKIRFKLILFFEVRDIWPLTLVQLGNMKKYNLLIILFQFIENFAYRIADYVISVLPNAAAHMVNHGLDIEKYVYIPNGIEINEYISSQEYINYKNIELLKKNKFIVGYIGTIGIANALEFFIEAANILKGNKKIHFLIVGDGGDKEKLLKITEDQNITNITFLKTVPKSQVQSIINYFDICYIGWREKKIYKFGISANKIFDYMFAEKPILISIDSDFDLVTESQCGIKVKAEDPFAIAEGIKLLYNMSDQERNMIGMNGKKYVIDNHNYKKLANKYIQLFNK